MSKPLDVAMLHIRAQAWAQKVYSEYYESRDEITPERIPPQIGENDGENRPQFENVRRTQEAPDNIY